MLSWVVLNFVLVIYSNTFQLTDSLIGPLAMARRVIWMSVLLLRSFLGNGLLVFSGTQHGVRGSCGVMQDRAWFF